MASLSDIAKILGVAGPSTATHVNHPSAIWCRESDKNYEHLFALFVACLNEYTVRYSKHHSAESLVHKLVNNPTNIPVGVFTEPTPAMPDQYKVNNDSISSYRNYYNGEKTSMYSWKKRSKPAWAT